MATITLHPVNHHFANDTGCAMETWECSPAHLPSLLRTEYRFMRGEGVSRRVARWHVHRMLAMLDNHFGWHADLLSDDDVEDDFLDDYDDGESGRDAWQLDAETLAMAGYPEDAESYYGSAEDVL